MIAVEKADAEESLSAALPALEEARLALSDLEKNDVTEIRLTSYALLPCGFYYLYACRSFAKPPVQVQTVCECIVALRGYKEINWKTAKGMMAETNFLSSLQNMDVDGISQGQVYMHV